MENPDSLHPTYSDLASPVPVTRFEPSTSQASVFVLSGSEHKKLDVFSLLEGPAPDGEKREASSDVVENIGSVQPVSGLFIDPAFTTGMIPDDVIVPMSSMGFIPPPNLTEAEPELEMDRSLPFHFTRIASCPEGIRLPEYGREEALRQCRGMIGGSKHYLKLGTQSLIRLAPDSFAAVWHSYDKIVRLSGFGLGGTETSEDPDPVVRKLFEVENPLERKTAGVIVACGIGPQATSVTCPFLSSALWVHDDQAVNSYNGKFAVTQLDERYTVTSVRKGKLQEIAPGRISLARWFGPHILLAMDGFKNGKELLWCDLSREAVRLRCQYNPSGPGRVSDLVQVTDKLILGVLSQPYPKPPPTKGKDLKIWDVTTGELAIEVDVPPLVETRSIVTSAVSSFDASRWWSSQGEDSLSTRCAFWCALQNGSILEYDVRNVASGPLVRVERGANEDDEWEQLMMAGPNRFACLSNRRVVLYRNDTDDSSFVKVAELRREENWSQSCFVGSAMY